MTVERRKKRARSQVLLQAKQLGQGSKNQEASCRHHDAGDAKSVNAQHHGRCHGDHAGKKADTDGCPISLKSSLGADADSLDSAHQHKNAGDPQSQETGCAEILGGADQPADRVRR